MHFSRTKKHMQASQRESRSMTASAVASLIRGLLRCRCALYLVNLNQWELPARSCAADMPLCLTRLRRWHEEPTGTKSTHTHTLGHMYVHIQYTLVHTHLHTYTHVENTAVSAHDWRVLRHDCVFKQDPPLLSLRASHCTVCWHVITHSHLVQGQK